MGTEPGALEAATVLVEILCFVLFWIMMRYTVLFRPLMFWEKVHAFLIGIAAGVGVVRLYTHPSLAFFRMDSLLAFALTAIYAAAILMMAALAVNAVYWLATRRSFLA